MVIYVLYTLGVSLFSKSKNSRVLVIGDLHFPYHHRDTFDFLKAIKKEFKPDRIISIGDEIDGSSFSYHESNPDLYSPGHELALATECIKELESVFPVVDVLESNHGSLMWRKQVSAGLPKAFFKDYREVYGVKNWTWHFDLTIKLSNGTHCYLHHGKRTNSLAVSQSMGMSCIFGHFHEKFEIQYWANSLGLYFVAQTGCLVDDDSLAMAYNNVNMKRPILGSLMIINGQPKLVPMILNSRGRWVKKLY